MLKHVHSSLECNKLYQTIRVFSPEDYLTKLYSIS